MKYIMLLAIFLMVFQQKSQAQHQCTLAGKAEGKVSAKVVSETNGFELPEGQSILDGYLVLVRDNDSLTFHLSETSFSSELKAALASLSAGDKILSDLIIVHDGEMAHKLKPFEFVIED